METDYYPYYQTRGDGRVERVCKHGVGHTVRIEAVRFVDWDDPHSIDAWWSHGCDGCCADYKRTGRGA